MLNLLVPALKIRDFFSFETVEFREQFGALFVFEVLLVHLKVFIIYGHGTEKWRSIWSVITLFTYIQENSPQNNIIFTCLLP